MMNRPALVLTTHEATGDFIALAITSLPTPFPAGALSNNDLLAGHPLKPVGFHRYSFHVPFNFLSEIILDKKNLMSVDCQLSQIGFITHFPVPTPSHEDFLFPYSFFE